MEHIFRLLPKTFFRIPFVLHFDLQFRQQSQIRYTDRRSGWAVTAADPACAVACATVRRAAADPVRMSNTCRGPTPSG